MGTMSASDAAPLPRAGEVFFDVRGESRTMRVSWYGDTGVAVFSIWNGGTCTGTFRLPIPELPRMIEALSSGPDGASPPPPAGQVPKQAPPAAADPGPPTAAMQLPGQVPGGQDYQDGPGYRDVPGRLDAPSGYPADQRVFPDQAGYGRPAADYEDGYADFPEEYAPEYADAGSDYAYGPRRYASGRHGYDEARDGEYEPMASDYEAPGGGYQDAEPGAGYPPAQAGQRAPSGPLPVGQWQHDQQGTGRYAGEHGPSTYAGDHRAADGYAAEAEPPYPGPGIDELGADPLEADYGGEAEQGYLPGPPTETFSPVAAGGSHSRRPGPPARDPAADSLAYHPGRAGRRERE
jgi:hypothetical protein